MALDLNRIINSLARGRNVDRALVFEAIEAALRSAVQRHFGADQEVEVQIDQEAGEAVVLIDGKAVDEGLLAQISAQTAKQVMIEKIRQAEADSVYDEYLSRVGELVTGKVARIEGNAVVVQLGEVAALLPRSGQLPRERFSVDQNVTAIVETVRRSGPRLRVVLSRTETSFVEALFKRQVSQIDEGRIQIRAIAWEAGIRCKVAVSSLDPSLNAVGVCVGARGANIVAIVEQLNGTRVDIVHWSDDPNELVANALMPAKVSRVILNEFLRRATAIVAEDQANSAIGSRGANIRLASRICGWDVNVVSEQEHQEQLERGAQMFSKLQGVSVELAIHLAHLGFLTFEDISYLEPDEFKRISGLPLSTVEKILDAAERYAFDESPDEQTATPEWRNLPELIIDPYLLNSLRMAESDDRQSRPVRSMLILAKNEQWDAQSVPELEITSRISTVYAARGTMASVEYLAQDRNVLAVQGSRPARVMHCEKSVPFVGAADVHAADVPERGGDALIAIIDRGIDVLHEAFLDDAGNSRILAVWDQCASSGRPPNAGYGRLHNHAEIQQYIQQGSVPSSLGRDSLGHGTHVASIAAGAPCGNFAGGMAPEAKIIVVIPDVETDKYDQGRGYEASHVDALAFIRDFAIDAGLPVVVNTSIGLNAGAHDGTSPLEKAFDLFTGLGADPGFVVVKSAGNARDKNLHAQLTMSAAYADELRWTSSATSRESDVLEVWFSSREQLRFRLTDPNGDTSDWVDWGRPHTTDFLPSGNHFELSYGRRRQGNGESMLLTIIRPGSATDIAPGEWSLEVAAGYLRSDLTVHAWIEQLESGSMEFLRHLQEDITVSIPGTAKSVITVGAATVSTPIRLADFSSCGPTRDDREKPDLVAPGVDITAAKSGTASDVETLDGTSMAAPHVTGAIALMMSRFAKQSSDQMSAAQIREILVTCTQNYTGNWSTGLGYGMLDCNAAINEVIAQKAYQP